MAGHDPRRACSGKDPAPASLPTQPADPESATGDVTNILSQIHDGDPSAAEQLLPLVYEELRRLAAAKMAQEKPGQTLQATALVHEAYIRLVDVEKSQHWDSRGHFFSAAAEAMRRILVENARRKGRQRHGGDRKPANLCDFDVVDLPHGDEVLDLDEALTQLVNHEPRCAELAKLRFFAGLTLDETASALDISLRTAKRDWAYARAWLSRELRAYETQDD
jgi:RNA polymerase sigma factor (TIGR02999 family)